MSANRIHSVRIVVHPDPDPDTSWLEPDPGRYHGVPAAERAAYERQDAERLAALYRGDWSFIGIQARAEVFINGVRQHIVSGGLWGIEDDSDRSHLLSVARDESADLAEILTAIGFDAETVRVACVNALADF